MSELDVYKDIFGVAFDAERLEQNLSAYADILSEIQKLRQLDLSNVQPAVIFSPLASKRETSS